MLSAALVASPSSVVSGAVISRSIRVNARIRYLAIFAPLVGCAAEQEPITSESASEHTAAVEAREAQYHRVTFEEFAKTHPTPLGRVAIAGGPICDGAAVTIYCTPGVACRGTNGND